MIVFATTCFILCMAVAMICVGVIVVGNVRESLYLRHIERLEEAQEQADYDYWQSQSEEAWHHHLVYERGEGLILDRTASEAGYDGEDEPVLNTVVGDIDAPFDPFAPCGYCRRCAIHDDPSGCLTVEQYERDHPEEAAAAIAAYQARSAT